MIPPPVPFIKSEYRSQKSEDREGLKAAEPPPDSTREIKSVTRSAGSQRTEDREDKEGLKAKTPCFY